MGTRRNDPFHNPFLEAQIELKRKVKTWRRDQREGDRDRRGADRAQPGTPPVESPHEPPHQPPHRPPHQLPDLPSEGDEERSFAQAMAGVTPLAPDRRVGPGRGSAPPRAVPDADVEAYAALADLVAGHGEFDISDTVEYVEGLAPGVDRRLVKRLRRGDFALQGHLDLHGHTRDEARAAVERFLAESRVAGKRCVLLVHGRGLNSPDRVPVLKNALVAWLTRGGLSRRILAFATARPTDGGAGALYVLLRK